MPWLFCKICRMSLHVCHAVKIVFPVNIRRFSNIQENLLKSPDYTTCLFFKSLQNSAKYRLQIMLYGNCYNSPSFLNNYLFFYFFRKILRHLLLVFNFEKLESTHFAKMNRKTTTRITFFIKPWQAKHLGWSEC